MAAATDAMVIDLEAAVDGEAVVIDLEADVDGEAMCTEEPRLNTGAFDGVDVAELFSPPRM